MKAFGYWKPIVALFVSLGAGLWVMVDHMPWSVMAAVILTAFVSTIYLLLLPAVIAQLASNGANASGRKKPDLSMYRLHESFTLRQAACLLAGSDPMLPALDFEARNWSSAIYATLKSGKISRVRTKYDDYNHTFPDAGGYEPHSETVISREQFLTFCQLHNKKPKFLAD